MATDPASPDGSGQGGASSISSNGISRLAEASLPTRWGEFRVVAFLVDGQRDETLALLRGDLASTAAPLVRLHSECLTGEALGSIRCDCGDQLAASLARIAEVGCGALLYLRQEGRGIGLVNKLRAYALQDGGLDTVDANLALGLPVDARDYTPAAAILRHLGVARVRLLTNNPAKQHALEENGIEVVERIPVEATPNPTNTRYLLTKAARMGHALSWGESLELPGVSVEPSRLNGTTAHEAGVGHD
jgi:GTP cyclohydrolase II